MAQLALSNGLRNTSWNCMVISSRTQVNYRLCCCSSVLRRLYCRVLPLLLNMFVDHRFGTLACPCHAVFILMNILLIADYRLKYMLFHGTEALTAPG